MDNLLFSFATLGADIVNGLTALLGELWYLVLINAIGFIAILVKIIETQSNKRSKIVFLAMLNYLLWIIYFILNGDFTSGIVSCITFAQTLILLQREKYKWINSIWFAVLFVALQVIAGIFTYKSLLSLFSICAGILTTFVYFAKNEKVYRYLFLATMVLWLGNGIVNSYAMALLHDSLSTVSVIVAIVRYDILHKNKN